MKHIIVIISLLVGLSGAFPLQAELLKIERKCYKKKAYPRSATLGIKGNGSGGKIEVRMFFKNHYGGGGRNKNIIYGAYSQTNNQNGFQANSWIVLSNADNAPWYCGGNAVFPWFCGDNDYSVSSTQYKQSMMQAFNSVEAIPDGTGDFAYWPVASIDMVIELELTGDATLADIKEIRLPGVDPIYATDFIQTGYATDHNCHNNSSSFCSTLSDVRSISNLNATDVVIQAHRGIWGAPGTVNENSLGAMQAAKNQGIFLVESDIMPYGITKWQVGEENDPNFAKPAGLVCFHDYFLERYTNYSGSQYIFNESRSNLEAVKLFEPRSTTVSNQDLLFYDELVQYVKDNNMFLCVDMKNLEPKGSGASCTQVCAFDNAANKTKSLMYNLKKGIEIANTKGALKNIAIKTYESYEDIKTKLVGEYGLSESLFNKILWAPMIAPNSKWEIGGGNTQYDPEKLKDWLGGWFAHNEVVLYYETNFFNDYDNQTAVLLRNDFCYTDANGDHCVTAMEYIYHMAGRRAGIFSEEPVGSKGVVNRWGSWKLKDPTGDRRGDHIWLLEKPFMQHAVITTDRSDLWEQLND